ncbi:unnamed protein product [Chilo suppressalis]|uniref:SMP-30/Gluconolactonase/LRE-like region domain-containing protein n=1 Tax=Chilo suppressalis TaxID=168631 RepID=A0ABN8B3F2_CHISP|nr:hypothetical protein evm_010936 [Chilo suppressalis]CAH0402491.1 unnamed protein product [Chilo suppressalis]
MFIQLIYARRFGKLTDDRIYRSFSFTNTTYAHAESPVWDPLTNTLYWVDVLNQKVHSLHYYTREHHVKHIHYGEVNVVLPVANSSRLLLGVRSEVFLLDWDKRRDAALRLVAALDVGSPDNIFNEGAVDAMGRLWAGTKGPQDGDKVQSDHGVLYVLEGPRFAPEVRLKPVSISNGMAWAPNNTILYYVDSETKKIDAFDFDLAEGTISKRRTILNLQKQGYATAIPDGITIDKDGFLWVALMFNGSVLRIDPDSRRITETIKLPTSRTTSVTWAGPGLRHLVITTSRRNMAAEQLQEEPLAGSIFFFYHLNTSGIPSHKLQFENADYY